MPRTMEIPERIYRRVERKTKTELSSEYTDIFGIVKDEIDPAAPHDMASIRCNIAKRRKDYAR